MALNMLKPCRRNPTISAYTALEGQFDFNKTPLAPPGINVMEHENPQQCKTSGVHGVPGWYIGTAMKHYLCYTCYTPNTRGVRHADVVEFFPQHIVMPGLSGTEQATKAAKELMHEIKNIGPQTPFTNWREPITGH